ncbi:MAG TPA: C40 family peptidase [Gryllotalpicola sp.]
MTETPGGSFRRPAALSIGAAAMGVVTASISIIAHPASAAAADYPSWNDVQHAKADVSAQQAMVNRINGLVGQLQDQATEAGMESEMALEKYHQAQGALDDATAKAASLQKQADEAGKTAKTSSIRAGLLASHLMRSAGTDGSLGLLLEGGDAGAADKLLYQLGTMSQLTAQSRQIYDQAVADRNTAETLTGQAKAAQQERKKAADAAQQALQTAQIAAAAAQAAVTTQQQKQTELTAQLASLKNISVHTAQQYVAGQQAAAAAKAAAEAAAQQREAAAKAAAARKAEQDRQAADAAQAGSAGSGGSGGSGGSNGSGTGGTSAPPPPSAPSGPPTTTAPPSSSIVDTVLNYARAQLGKPYIFDGSGPVGYDCSGLTMEAYAAAGIYIGGHGVVYQYRQAAALGQLVPRSQAQPGDLIFWGTAPNGLYHIGIYLGGGQMIAAPQVGENVKIQAVWGSPIDVVARPSIGH